MSIMPGAVWRPITIPGGNPGARTKGRGVVLHVAASEAASLFGFFNNNPNANSHFYVNKAGVIEQYVDTDLQAWASMAANKNTISVETQGGVTNPDGEPWNPAQVAALGRICAWAHATEGTPLAPMPNSLPGSRGIGYHRLGIDPWRVSGGEVWSSSRGKLCPGAAKVAQIPAVIAAATNPGTPTTGGFLVALTDSQQGELYYWLQQLYAGTFKGGTSMPGGKPITALLADIGAQVGAVGGQVQNVANSVRSLPAPTVDVQSLASALVSALGDAQAHQVAAAVLAGLDGATINTKPAG